MFDMEWRTEGRDPLIAQNSVLNLTDVYNIFKSDMETIDGAK